MYQLDLDFESLPAVFTSPRLLMISPKNESTARKVNLVMGLFSTQFKVLCASVAVLNPSVRMAMVHKTSSFRFIDLNLETKSIASISAVVGKKPRLHKQTQTQTNDIVSVR